MTKNNKCSKQLLKLKGKLTLSKENESEFIFY